MNYSVTLEVQFYSEEDTNQFFGTLNTGDTVQEFVTDGFFIDTENGYIENEGDAVQIVGESECCFDGYNVQEFFREIENRGREVGVRIKNIYLKFFSYYDDEEGFIFFIRELKEAAKNKLYRHDLVDEFGEDYEEETDEETKELIAEKKEFLNTCINAPWQIVCGINEISEYMKNDSEGRGSLFDFEEDITVWARIIINKFEFPTDEGCNMWAMALDENGESLWDNI